jgi:hypothetical protein
MQNDGMQWLVRWQRRHPEMRFAFPILLLVGLVLLRAGWVWSALRWLWLRWETSRPAEARNNPQLAARLYNELLRLLEIRGFLRSEAQTPREFAASLAFQPALAPAVNEFTDLYLQARFGASACDTVRLRALLDAVRSAPRPQ